VLERRELARGRDQDACTASQEQRVGVARAEVDRIAARELVPRERLVVAARMELAPDRDDRALAAVVDQHEAPSLRSLHAARVDGDASRLELLAGEPAVLVVAENGEEVHRVGEPRKLHGRDRPSAGRLLPRLLRMDDVPRARHGLHRDELQPLDVTDNRCPHPGMLTNRGS
jgi:hypothetical protein